VRSISGIALIAAIVGWLACRVELPPSDFRIPIVATQWRRTTAGWEKLADMTAQSAQASYRQSVWAAHPHPAVASLLILMLSVAALLAFSPANSPQTELSRSASVE
jgi:hypothetical protein